VSVDVVPDLEVLVEQAEVERVLAEQRAQRARDLLRRVRDGRSASDRARRELAERVGEAEVALDAARDRLGPARLEHGKAERELERLADAAAGGSDPAVRSLARQRDVVETCAEIVSAHERRAGLLSAELEAAQSALEAHDASDREHVGGELEELLQDVARHVDGQLGRVCEASLLVRGLVERRRGLRPKEPWAPVWLTGAPYDHVLDAVRYALGPLEAPFVKHGRTVSRNSKPLVRVVQNAVQCWATGRGSGAAVPPAEAA
jgi:hypothetical protein